MLDRLVWSHRGDSHIAYPEGEEFPHRVARLTPDSSLIGAWSWSVVYEQAHTGGVAETVAKAAESADVAWPLVKAQAVRLAERAEWERRMHALLDQAQAGKVGPEAFSLGSASREDLDWLIARAHKRPRSTGLDRLLEAIAELSKRPI